MPRRFYGKIHSFTQKYPKALKVGFSICIDDLPDCYINKEQVQKWESQFWKKEIEPNIFKAPIDTTFAVYKPYFKGEIIDFFHLYLRTGFPYSVKHLPWYIDSANPSEEERYYINHLQTSTHWSEQNKNESFKTTILYTYINLKYNVPNVSKKKDKIRIPLIQFFSLDN